jgi:pimeloyl-ACP methyl ester carboxylesterase
MTDSPQIVTPDGHTLSTIFEQPTITSLNRLVILAHGIFTDKGEKGRFDRLAARLTRSGFAVLRFDFRGHGDSPIPSRDFSVIGSLVDYISAVRWGNQHADMRLSVIASSFGGSIVLLDLLRQEGSHVENTVLLNPVLDYRATFTDPSLEWGKSLFPEEVLEDITNTGSATIENTFTVSLRVLLEFETLRPYEGIDFVRTPLLVFHGDKDDKVPVGPAIEHFSSRDNIEFDLVKGAAHAFKEPKYEEYVHDKTVKWLTTH